MVRKPHETPVDALIAFIGDKANATRNRAHVTIRRVGTIAQDLKDILVRQGIPNPTVSDLVTSFIVKDQITTLVVLIYKPDPTITLKGGFMHPTIEALQAALKELCSVRLPCYDETRARKT